MNANAVSRYPTKNIVRYLFLFAKYKFEIIRRRHNVENRGSNPMIDALKDQITEIWAEIDALKGNKRGQKTEVDNDEQHNAGNANVSTV